VKTLVFPPASGIGHTAYVGVIAHQLTGREAFLIAAGLVDDGLPVLPIVTADHVLHLYPLEEVDTAGEVTILRAFEAATDSPVAWHGPRARVKPSCLLCGTTGVVLEHDLCGRCGKPFQPAPVWGVA
jgi:hypothetical protein